MEHEKFDRYGNGEYWINYFDRDKEFYNTIGDHIKKSIPDKNTIGIDIGAGPGIGAKLISNLKFETKLTGFEPSETSFDGEKLSKEFSDNNVSITYTAKHGGILDIETPGIDSLDYVLVLRASHEIAASLESKTDFFGEIDRIIQGLKKDGILIIAEPQYTEENAPEHIIKKIQEYQKKNIGHCHVPSDYINAKEMKMQSEKLGLKLIEETLIPNNKLLDYLNAEGCNLKKSPCGFYVQTFKK